MPNRSRAVSGILKGMKAEDLPVQAPMKYQLVTNLKTAKRSAAPPARGDEVIE